MSEPPVARTAHPLDQPPYRAWLRPDDGALVLSGSLDALVVDQVAEDLEKYSEHHQRSLVVDLSAVDYLSSRGVSALLSATKELRRHGADLELTTAPGGAAAQVLRVCGIPHRTR